jgi:hypothetical protein
MLTVWEGSIRCGVWNVWALVIAKDPFRTEMLAVWTLVIANDPGWLPE